MTATIPLGRCRGIPLGAHWSVLATLALLTVLLADQVLPSVAGGTPTVAHWGSALVAAVLLLVSLLAHELTHALLAQRYGVGVKSITLWALGGVATLEGDPPTPRASAVVAGGGPVMSLVLGALFYLAATITSHAWLVGLPQAVLVWLALTNGIVGVFNLLPAAPLDGGRLLRAWLWARSGDRDRATVRAAAVGQSLGYVLVALGIAEGLAFGAFGGIWLAVVGLFVTSAAVAERQQVRVFGKLAGVRVRDVMTPDPVIAPGWWTVEAFVTHVADARVRHRVYPVVDFHGRPVGTVRMAVLSAARTTATRVQDVARALDERSLVLAGEPVTDVLRRTASRRSNEVIVVIDDGRLVGIVTRGDIMRAVGLSRSRHGLARDG